jgi:2,4-dienoyl-CoA reductase-like NADH-dependent reductase (Old Yellow Enzyme family)
MDGKSTVEIISAPITLPCGLKPPNRLVKYPMQETLAEAPLLDPPVSKWRNIYKEWAHASYGLLITEQVQVNIRFLSIAGDVVRHDKALAEPHFSKWKEWAKIAQEGGTPCIIQLAHPGRMSPAGAGVSPSRHARPLPITLPEIDQVVVDFVRGAKVARAAGFAGVQLHGAHGFLLSQFLSPETNCRDDDYGGTLEKRMAFLKRLVTEIREVCPPPFCLRVKLDFGDYMAQGGLSTDEALEQVRWLLECGMVDFVEISSGNAEQSTSKLHSELKGFGDVSRTLTWIRLIDKMTISKAPVMRESTRIREVFFTDFAEQVQKLDSRVPVQLRDGFRSRIGIG